MNRRTRHIVAWIMLAQVGLVGGIGTGLHTVFNCEHAGCRSACCTVEASSSTGCSSCRFCSRSAERDNRQARNVVSSAGCEDCAVCDLLLQFHNAAPVTISLPAIELATGETTLHRRNAVIAATTRLSLSRGPPVA